MVVAPSKENELANAEENFQTKLQAFPLLPTEDRSNEEPEGGGKGKGKKRRAAAASTASNKKGKKK